MQSRCRRFPAPLILCILRRTWKTQRGIYSWTPQNQRMVAALCCYHQHRTLTITTEIICTPYPEWKRWSLSMENPWSTSQMKWKQRKGQKQHMERSIGRKVGTYGKQELLPLTHLFKVWIPSLKEVRQCWQALERGKHRQTQPLFKVPMRMKGFHHK